MRAAHLVLLLATIALLAAACVHPNPAQVPGARAWDTLENLFGDDPAGIRVGFVGTGRNYGRVADLWIVNPGTAVASVDVPAGSVLHVGPSGTERYRWQRYALWTPVRTSLAPGEGRWIALRGACLDSAKDPWPAGWWMRGANFLRPRDWASRNPDDTRGALDARTLVVVLMTTDGPFAAAKSDTAYRTPSLPHGDDVARQWALWGVTDGKRKADVLAAVEREIPHATPEAKAKATDEVWAAATVIVNKGGEKVVKDEGLDPAILAQLDISLK